VHLALEGKKFITDPQLEWLATGRYKTPDGKLTDVMPMANPMASTQALSSENPGSVNTEQEVRRNSEEFLNDYVNQSIEAALLSNALNMNQKKTDPMAKFQQMFQQMGQTNLMNPLIG